MAQGAGTLTGACQAGAASVSRGTGRGKARRVLLAAACLALAGLLAAPPFLVDLAAHPYHVDEDVWVESAYYYRLFFKDRNLRSPDWESSEARHRPPIAKYTLGLGLDIAGCTFEADAGRLHSWWARNEHLPGVNPGMPPKRLLAARTTSALLALAAGLVLFLIGWRISGPLAGLLMCVLFAYSPCGLLVFRQAMAESTLVFFSVAAVCVQVWLLPALADFLRRPLSAVLFVLLESACLCGAVGTKLNGALTAAAFVLATALLSIIVIWPGLRSEDGQRRRLGQRLARSALIPIVPAVVGMGAFALLVFLDPFLRPAPVGRFIEMFKAAREALAASARPFPEDALPTLGSKAAYVFGALLSGRSVLLPQRVTLAVYAALFAAGFVILSGMTLRQALQGRLTGTLPVWAWAVTTLVGVTAWIPTDWERFLAPAIPVASCLAGLALAEALRFAWRRVAVGTPRW